MVNRILALALVAGCADIEAARRTQDPASAPAGERTVSSGEIGLGPQSTLTFERGLEIALAYNPTIIVGRSRLEGAAARLVQLKAGVLPRISVSADYRVQQVSGGSVDHVHGGSLSADQLLFDFGKTSAVIDQGVQAYLAADADLKGAQNEIAFSFRQSFFNVLKQRELVHVAEETVRQFEKRLEQVKGFVDVGTRVRYDLTKAQVDLGNAQLNLVRSRTALSVGLAVLNNVMGLAEDPRYVLEKPNPDPEWKPAFDELVGDARKNHPRLIAQRFREMAAIAAIDAAIADFYPTFSLGALFGWSGALTPVGWNWFVGPSVNWLLFGGNAKIGALNEVVAGLRETRAVRAQIEQQIFLDIRQAVAQMEDARERLRIVNLTVTQAEENLILVQGRYENQKASSVELTDAQVTLANAKGEQVQAEFDIRIAIAALKRATGSVK